jgi:type IV pilus assembly protein PilP
MSTTAKSSWVALALAVLAGVGCGAEVSPPNPPPPPSRTAPAASSSAMLPVAKGQDYTENDFVESDRNRDPFRPYVAAPQGPKPLTNQREVKLPQYSIDELRLIGIIMAGDGPRAMFVDPTGKGHVLMKGNYLCRPEVVHVGGTNGPEYQLNWRVDRIRDGDVVLIRYDEANPTIPPATRVIPLHPEADQKNPELTAPPG